MEPFIRLVNVCISKSQFRMKLSAICHWFCISHRITERICQHINAYQSDKVLNICCTFEFLNQIFFIVTNAPYRNQCHMLQTVDKLVIYVKWFIFSGKKCHRYIFSLHVNRAEQSLAYIQLRLIADGEYTNHKIYQLTKIVFRMERWP